MTTSDHPKRVLYHGPSAEHFDGFARSVVGAAGSGGALGEGARRPTLTWSGLTCSLVNRPGLRELVEDLHEHYVNLLVIDLRCVDDLCHHAERAFAILDALDAVEDIEDRFGFHRILVLVAGGQTATTDELILELGARGVGRVLRHEGFAGPGVADLEWGARFLDEAQRMLRDREPGGRALCAAGGGITGIFFELGVMKCLDDALGSGGVNGFDMYFGISAGAVVTGPIAVGYSVDEFMASIAGVRGGRVPPIDLRLFRLGHLDLPGFLRRMAAAAKTAWNSVVSPLGPEHGFSRDQVLSDYSDLVPPPFRADRFEAMLRSALTAPGATNDFRRLKRPLYIGATDQDERTHVLFGDEANDTVPISRAIQASLSINPAFSATSIRGRYYEDGAITRTSNFAEAIRRGATLIFVIDPFLPYVARTPGFNDLHGVLYNIDQDVRTISYTRYETTRNWVLRRRPDVSCYTFVPGNRQRRLISQNPMDHRPYLEIWRGAYLSTFKRLSHLRHRLEGDLRVHGVRLDLARAGSVAARLEASRSLSFGDFFPDGRVHLRLPPLVGDARSST